MNGVLYRNFPKVRASPAHHAPDQPQVFVKNSGSPQPEQRVDFQSGHSLAVERAASHGRDLGIGECGSRGHICESRRPVVSGGPGLLSLRN
jgi:hypothetical protein